MKKIILTLIFTAVIFQLSCNNILDTLIPVMVPVAEISIDGNYSDWDSVPIYNNHEKVSGIIKIATNADRNKLFIYAIRDIDNDFMYAYISTSTTASFSNLNLNANGINEIMNEQAIGMGVYFNSNMAALTESEAEIDIASLNALSIGNLIFIKFGKTAPPPVFSDPAFIRLRNDY